MNNKDEYSFSDYLRENQNMPMLIGLAGLLLLTFIVLATGVYTHRYGADSQQASNYALEGSSTVAKEAVEPIDRDAVNLGNVQTITGLEKVDMKAQKHFPGAREEGMDWDDSYLSESGDRSEYVFIDQTDSKELYCEVHGDRENNRINKISTVKESREGLLEVVDYYYRDNKPYFISQRYETIYTPTYESTDKAGVRFYFTDDVMVRCRTVVAGSLFVSQTGLSLQENPDYEEFDYFKAPDAIREQYDSFETEWLNRGYNILEAVKDSEPVGKLCGIVTDIQGDAIGGCSVLVQNMATGEMTYATETYSSGEFNIYVKQDSQQYRICILKDGYDDMYISGLALDSRSSVYEYNSITLYPSKADTAKVTLNVYDGDTYRSDAPAVSGVSAHISVREGFNTRLGKEAAQCDTDEQGNAELKLKPGCYTVETVCDGYITGYSNIEVSPYGSKKQLFVVKQPRANMVTALLTWDSDADMDLTVFTPYQGDNGDMAYIGGVVLEDEHGNSIANNNTGGCETAYLDLSKNGSYKIYVSDYSDIISGSYGSDALCNGNATLCVYYSDGTSKTCELNSDSYGMLWEAAEVSRSSYTSRDHLYSSAGGKKWWNARKDIVKSQENVQFGEGMQLTGRLESDYSYAYLDADWMHSKKYSMQFDAPIRLVIKENEVERTYTYENIDVSFDLKQDYDALSHLDLLVGQYVTGTIKEAGITEEGEPYLVLQSLELLHEAGTDNLAVPKEYLAILADRINDGAVAYTFIYLNDNSTPELVILNQKDSSHGSGADIYTYDNGSVELIGSFGSWGGNFTYYPMKNLIEVEETSNGSHSETYCYFDKHTVYTVDYESSMEFPEYGISRILGQYNMNGIEYVNPVPGRGNSVPTSAEEYEKQMESMFKNIDRNTGRYIDRDSCLKASRIEDIRFK